MLHERICLGCGAVFFVETARANRGKDRYCGRPCANKATSGSLEERFWAKVQKSETGCWLWTGMVNEHGYGRLRGPAGERGVYAHRLSYTLAYGPIADDAHVCHRCDNPPCVRPDHLWLGNQRANNTDRDHKGRGHRGERTGGVELTARQVQAIRAARATGTISNRALARAYGVSHSTVDDVVNRHTWAHVP